MVLLHSILPRRRWHFGAALAAAVLLSACGSGGDSSQGQTLPDYDPAPAQVNSPATEVKKDELRVPLQFTHQSLVAPGWQTPPHGADGVFLSAGHNDDILTFRAVDDTGTILWEAQRPLSCTGFTLTTADDEQSYAVLTDIDADVQTFGHTVAAAYDLQTGDQSWGPVEVPGPHHGPGIVFAAPSEEAMGESGPQVVLDPATGDVLIDERETPEVAILGEFHGIVLLVVDEQVQAHSASGLAQDGLTGQPKWSIPLDDYAWDTQRLTAKAPTPNPIAEEQSGGVLIGTNDTDRILVTLTDGQVIADQLSAAGQDPSSQTWVTIGENIVGYDVEEHKLYEESHNGADLIGVGAAIAYLRNAEGNIEARNVLTGAIGRSYDPQDAGVLTVPSVITATGAGILEADDEYYLVPAASAEDQEG
ncbi:hypothetical protein [Enteractinococcus coprophilus]|uniref:Pyrroloquinoline-quinone binding quinoprotein n=1 Tax=Enteractinococcus coprophilus TaxID=1027633 RepID=A0A543AP13_9MICC|nr:hypothetical protein [Enteractinococcus coprophilus]TQL74317.1 hypothetical protein FB556_0778 [Enteractinococcus coprophilus]